MNGRVNAGRREGGLGTQIAGAVRPGSQEPSRGWGGNRAAPGLTWTPTLASGSGGRRDHRGERETLCPAALLCLDCGGERRNLHSWRQQRPADSLLWFITVGTGDVPMGAPGGGVHGAFLCFHCTFPGIFNYFK